MANETTKLIPAMLPLQKLIAMTSKPYGKKDREFASRVIEEMCGAWPVSDYKALKNGLYSFALDGANISFTVKEKTEKTTAKK